MPLALEEQALLRAVAQVPLVVLPAPRHAAAQAQLFQKVLHRARVVARHRQVVRAQRAIDAQHRATPAVAAGAVFELQQREVVVAGQAQRPRRCQASDAAAGDEGVDGAGGVGGTIRPRLAQQVAALWGGAGETAVYRINRALVTGGA